MQYICPNCGKEMTEDTPGILICRENSCKQKMMKNDYGRGRFLGVVTTCWECPHFRDTGCRHCFLTDQEITGSWIIDPSCPLPRIAVGKD